MYRYIYSLHITCIYIDIYRVYTAEKCVITRMLNFNKILARLIFLFEVTKLEMDETEITTYLHWIMSQKS